MKYPFNSAGLDHPDTMNLTDFHALNALIQDICSNGSSSSSLVHFGDERRRTSRYARQRVILDIHVVGLLCLVGFVGNALTIAVLRRDWQDGSNATNWLLKIQYDLMTHDGHMTALRQPQNGPGWLKRHQLAAEDPRRRRYLLLDRVSLRPDIQHRPRSHRLVPGRPGLPGPKSSHSSRHQNVLDRPDTDGSIASAGDKVTLFQVYLPFQKHG